MSEIDAQVRQRAARIRLILLDVDGVLTDGRIHLDSAGGEARAFFVRDGLGIRLGQEFGLVFGIVSGFWYIHLEMSRRSCSRSLAARLVNATPVVNRRTPTTAARILAVPVISL